MQKKKFKVYQVIGTNLTFKVLFFLFCDSGEVVVVGAGGDDFGGVAVSGGLLFEGDGVDVEPCEWFAARVFVLHGKALFAVIVGVG